MVAHADKLQREPVVGNYYMVPCVRVLRSLKVIPFPPGLWPVIGPLHDDKDLGIIQRHWHFDARFLTGHQFSFLSHNATNVDRIFKVVLCGTDSTGRAMPNVSGVNIIRRRCMRVNPPFPKTRIDGFAKLQDDMAGLKVTCSRCPHRGLPLESLPRVPGTNEVICVGHGLRYDLTTGILVRQTGRKALGVPGALVNVRPEAESDEQF